MEKKEIKIEDIIAELEEWHQKKGRAFFLLAADLEAEQIHQQVTNNRDILEVMIGKALTYKVNRQLLWRSWVFVMKHKLKMLFKLYGK